MKLGELLDVCSVYMDVRVLDSDDKEVAIYDGRNSIPVEYNDSTVSCVSASPENRLDVVIC